MLKWQIGDVTITRVVELTTTSLGPHLLPQASAQALSELPWLAPFVEDGKIILSVHALVIESLGQRLLVDPCIGNDKVRSYPRWNAMQTNFLEDLASAGFTVDSIDSVMCTHMHVDHVGWNTRLVEDWRDEEQEYGPVIEDSVQPIFDAGLADLVNENHRVTDEVWLEPTPGHTPGHVSVHITSRGEEAVITGDMIHHPCQIAHVDWSSSADWDQALAAATRGRFIERYADRPVLIIGTHFATPTAGHRLDY
jgi:glyoxylase-like metal-dependent hydrolase (beta-lactamase superfamily II)